MPLAFDFEVDAALAAAEEGNVDLEEAAEETKEDADEGESVNSDDSTSQFAVKVPKLIWDTNKIIRFSGTSGEPLMKCTFCKKEWRKWNHTKAMGHAIGGCGDIQQCKKVPIRWIKVFKRINGSAVQEQGV